jgi:hypothetical protein
MHDDTELTDHLVATLERMSATGPIEEALVAVRHRAQRRRRARNVARVGAVAALVVSIAVPVAWWASAGDEARRPVSAAGSVLEAPPVGHVAAGFLDDGTPVFVRRDANGAVRVFAAVSTHVPLGVAKAIGWCERAQVFEEWIHGSSWDRRGVKLNGPAPRGLWEYRTEVEGDRVRVVSETPVPGAPIGTEGVPPEGPSCAFDATARPGSLVVHYRSEQAVDLDAALSRAPGTVVMVRDLRFRAVDGGRSLCDAQDATRCARVQGSEDSPIGDATTYGFVRVVDEHTVTDVIVYRFPPTEPIRRVGWPNAH